MQIQDNGHYCFRVHQVSLQEFIRLTIDHLNLLKSLVDKLDKNGYLSVEYDKLAVIALSAIDKIYEKNQELEARLSKLETILASSELN